MGQGPDERRSGFEDAFASMDGDISLRRAPCNILVREGSTHEVTMAWLSFWNPTVSRFVLYRRILFVQYNIMKKSSAPSPRSLGKHMLAQACS
jgi:hypothetical protein